MRRLRIILAVETALLRAGLRSLSSGFAGLHLIAETGNGREAVSLAKEHRPQLVLIGGLLLDLRGQETALGIRRCSPLSRLVTLSANGQAAAPGNREFL